MSRWFSTRTAIGAGWVLIGLGMVPIACLYLWARTHSSQPLSEQINIQRGQFVSSYFVPRLDGIYQINLYWSKFPRTETQVDLDWRIVDSQDQVIDQGTYNSALDGANIVELGEYHPQLGVRQRIIVDVHQEINGPSGEAMLQIGIPEVGLDRAEGAYPLAMGWAAITAVPGIVMLGCAWLWRRLSPKS